jgi:hypothetical protein
LVGFTWIFAISLAFLQVELVGLFPMFTDRGDCGFFGFGRLKTPF